VYAPEVRLAVLLAALLVAACSDRPRRAASPAVTADARTLDAAARDFTRATGPVDGLWPGMTVEAARAFLTDAGIAFQESSPNAKRPHWIATTLDGWGATLYFDEGYDVIAQILLQSPSFATEAEALALVDRTAAPWGPPAEQRHVDGADGTWSETFRAWKNDRVTLELNLHAAHDRDGTTTWTVFASWSRPGR
jgi:hypothetical protein